MAKKRGVTPRTELSKAVGRALKRSAKAAREMARMHGTPLVVWRDGKVVLEKP